MKALVISLLFLAGCTSTTVPTAQNDKPIPNPGVTDYSASYLQKSGRQTAAGQLAASDPSITVTHGGH